MILTHLFNATKKLWEKILFHKHFKIICFETNWSYDHYAQRS